jgi:hypothetical protein
MSINVAGHVLSLQAIEHRRDPPYTVDLREHAR